MRLFLAAELPRDIVRRVGELRTALRHRLHGWRWVPPQGVHLTLRFLGEVSEERDRATRASWARAGAATPPFRLRLTALGRFPPRGAPRVLWVGVEETAPGGALSGLAAALEREARGAGWEAEHRAFRAHLTLARRARGVCADPPPAGDAAGSAEGWVRALVLFRSRLGPAGASYTALERFVLG